MKTVAIIEARMTSTRLPGKILMPVLGKPLLELLVERLKRASSLDQIIVATTTNATDDIVEDLTKKLGIGCFRGSEEDVLDRVLRAAHAFQADIIVEITGDCPLVDPLIVDNVVITYKKGQYDYVSTAIKRTYPRGLDTGAFSTNVLENVARLTDDPVDHEHVTLYIYEHPDIFSLFNIESHLPERQWNYRLTVDTNEDFVLIKSIYEILYPINPAFSFLDVLALLDNRPDLRKLNQEILQKRVR